MTKLADIESRAAIMAERMGGTYREYHGAPFPAGYHYNQHTCSLVFSEAGSTGELTTFRFGSPKNALATISAVLEAFYELRKNTRPKLAALGVHSGMRRSADYLAGVYDAVTIILGKEERDRLQSEILG